MFLVKQILTASFQKYSGTLSQIPLFFQILEFLEERTELLLRQFQNKYVEEFPFFREK